MERHRIKGTTARHSPADLADSHLFKKRWKWCFALLGKERRPQELR
jgi:hypothetical protein